MTTSPSRAELAQTLRDLRIDAGLTLAEVSERAGMSVSTVSRLENGHYVPTAEQAESLATATGARAAARRRVAALAGELRERTTKRQVLLRASGGPRQRKFGEIEAAAKHVRTYCESVVPGLLQTADYTRVIFASGLPHDQVDDAVQARRQRRQILDDPHGPEFTQILAEGALRWHLGSPALMAEQCDQIAEDAARGPRIRVGIVPWTRPLTYLAGDDVDLYDERAALVGTLTGTAYITARADVEEYLTLFRRLTEAAVFGDEAAAIARRIAGEYRALDATGGPSPG